MTLKEILERQEKADFDILEWQNRLLAARNARAEWDTDYKKSAAILSNKVAIPGSKNSLAQFTDKMFHTNWLLKLCIWLESYISSAEVTGDLKSHSGSDDIYPDRLILEMELNRVLDRFEMVRDWCVNSVPSRIRYGMGVYYVGWNHRARDQYWRNGKPTPMALDSRRVWVDPGCSDMNFRDRKWIFAKIELSVADAKRAFPKFADIIHQIEANTDEGDAPQRKDRFDVYLCQYRQTKRMRMIDIEIYSEQKYERQQVPLEQVQEYFEGDGAELPDNIRIIDEGGDEPGYEAEIDTWYQFYFTPHIPDKPLTDIEYIGRTDHFAFWNYHRVDHDIYPRGTAYMLQDEQTLKSILLTKAAIEAIKNGRATPMVKEGAIKDLDEYIDNHNAFNYVGVIDAEWLEQNRGERPIDFVQPQFNPDVTNFLNMLLKDEMQQFTGGTDTLMGKAQYAGMSAAQTGMLQASGATYTKNDELSYRDFVKDIMQITLAHIAEYMTYEHTIDGVNENGQSQTMLINPNDLTDWDADRYFPEPMIENNPEAIRQLQEQRAMQLKSMGSMSTVRMLYELGYNDAERIAQEAFAEQNILQAIQVLQENPELMDKIMAVKQKQDTDKASKSEKESRGGKE